MDWKVTDREGYWKCDVIASLAIKIETPHNSLNGLSRSAISNVKSAISGQRFDGKSGSTLSIWSDDCRVILIGMGEVDDLTHKIARDAGAKWWQDCQKGWHKSHSSVHHWMEFRGYEVVYEGMMLRDYAFLKYRQKDREEAEKKGNWNLTIQSSERYLIDLHMVSRPSLLVLKEFILLGTSVMSHQIISIRCPMLSGPRIGPKVRIP